ncbi:Arc family DNA-binding protein [Variovorax sp. CAN2819]|uniref:Arc family DNA-binding protein n=1 Tax=Variovorax sp. CAN15 TaxID=3046727 RepID=UPI002648AB18|nr:Arc family DNA-binding protein [Variovorax sp. CAN15]MDN6883910.1 Arc family DNA-binding protein [Variovorax sp. CAN15]
MEEDRYTRITLRLPKDLHTRLDDVADATSKSLNAEIVGRLQESFSTPTKGGDEATAFMLATLQYELADARVTATRLRHRAASLGSSIRILLLMMAGAKSPIEEIERELLFIAASADAALADPEMGQLVAQLERLQDSGRNFDAIKQQQDLSALPPEALALLADVDERMKRLREEKLRREALMRKDPRSRTMDFEAWEQMTPPELDPEFAVETAAKVARIVKASIPAKLMSEKEVRTALGALAAIEAAIAAGATSAHKTPDTKRRAPKPKA